MEFSAFLSNFIPPIDPPTYPHTPTSGRVIGDPYWYP